MKKTIYLSGAAFWGGKDYFEELPGVLSVSLGTTDIDNDVSVSNTWLVYPSSYELGTSQLMQVNYDDAVIPLPLLLKAFYEVIDPYSTSRQINYDGELPEAKIYYTDADDEPVILESIAEFQKGKEHPVTVACEPLKEFVPIGQYAEDYIMRNNGEDEVIDSDYAESFTEKHEMEFGA